MSKALILSLVNVVTFWGSLLVMILLDKRMNRVLEDAGGNPNYFLPIRILSAEKKKEFFRGFRDMKNGEVILKEILLLRLFYNSVSVSMIFSFIVFLIEGLILINNADSSDMTFKLKLSGVMAISMLLHGITLWFLSEDNHILV